LGGIVARIARNALFDHHLKPGGLFAIEDWGTGYWEAWPDGRAWRANEPHHAGMVGFIKELIDALATRIMFTLLYCN
jgi:hypothetical protein